MELVDCVNNFVVGDDFFSPVKVYVGDDVIVQGFSKETSDVLLKSDGIIVDFHIPYHRRGVSGILPNVEDTVYVLINTTEGLMVKTLVLVEIIDKDSNTVKLKLDMVSVSLTDKTIGKINKYAIPANVVVKGSDKIIELHRTNQNMYLVEEEDPDYGDCESVVVVADNEETAMRVAKLEYSMVDVTIEYIGKYKEELFVRSTIIASHREG